MNRLCNLIRTSSRIKEGFARGLEMDFHVIDGGRTRKMLILNESSLAAGCVITRAIAFLNEAWAFSIVTSLGFEIRTVRGPCDMFSNTKKAFSLRHNRFGWQSSPIDERTVDFDDQTAFKTLESLLFGLVTVRNVHAIVMRVEADDFCRRLI